ncbi:MAG: NAD(+) diphosphatase [Nocardiopsaceae bacterium]|jgi:NAD+ diphosphatase|nr:NAD(+) diphosphatase [Nocardiopsaceae bacterium]
MTPAGRGGPASSREPVDSAWELDGLALSRGEVDRSTIHRNDPAWIEAAWAAPRTRVLVLTGGAGGPPQAGPSGGQAPVRFSEAGAGLVLVPAADAPAGLRFLLGVDKEGTAFFGVALPPGERALAEAIAQAAGGPAGGGRPDGSAGGAAGGEAAGGGPAGGEVPGGEARLAGLREAGPLLDDRDAGLMTHAVALANWHASHPHCPRCGAMTSPQPAGHSRVCPVDGSEHFPRIDPAVIMLVTDADDRCLLARNQAWPQRRVSILAGFVEPGESAEHAVVREVAEETGITVSEVRYLASQPWPMPQSLMLGFRARATSGLQIRVDDDEIAEARWFSRADLGAAMAAGEIRLPSPVSIAHQIIRAWYGGPLPHVW